MVSCNTQTETGNKILENESVESKLVDVDELKKEQIIYPGIGIGKLVIGKTNLEQLFSNDNQRSEFREEGFEFHFDQEGVLREIVLNNVGTFKSIDGKALGKTKEEVLGALGEPLSTGLPLMKGESRIGEMPSLNYEGITFLLQDTIVSTIVISEKQ